MSPFITALQTFGWEGQGGPGHWDGPGPWWPIFPLLWLVLLAGAAALAIWALRRRDRRAVTGTGEQVLAERFARGEIDEEEFRARRAVIREK